MKIRLENISKSYGKKRVFTGVNLEIEAGSFLLLRGASGSGKSTLLNIIGGIEPPTTGKVIIDDKDTSRLKGKARADFFRHQVGFIFQGFYLQPQLTVRENIALIGVFAGMPKRERDARAAKLAQTLGITEVLDRLPAEISGGQAERACAARALFMQPKIILADEPTNNLDPRNARNVLELLKQIQENTGVTMIMASHDPHAEAYATRIITFQDRRG